MSSYENPFFSENPYKNVEAEILKKLIESRIAKQTLVYVFVKKKKDNIYFFLTKINLYPKIDQLFSFAIFLNNTNKI